MPDLSTIDLTSIYCTKEEAAKQKLRYEKAVASFVGFTGSQDFPIYSAPGRTEIGGNHTDHQRGEVLAASVNKDSIAVVRPRSDNKIRILAEGFGELNVLTDDLAPRDSEHGTSLALVRGTTASVKEMGYKIGGFDAYITSDVLIGAGLSSSASFEVLIATILSGLYNDMKITPEDAAIASQKAENIYFGKPCGLMDQMACSVGGTVYIDFKDPSAPKVIKIPLDLGSYGYRLCITDTKGSHADLTPDYAAIPSELTRVANFSGKDKLRDVSLQEILDNVASLRAETGDRAILRALHFEQETKRAKSEADALQLGDFDTFLKIFRKSSDSSFKYLQNVYSNSDVTSQGIALALCISDIILGEDEVSRVHGGGFAGTIQAFVKDNNVERYRSTMDKVFGDGSCSVMSIRSVGGVRII